VLLSAASLISILLAAASASPGRGHFLKGFQQIFISFFPIKLLAVLSRRVIDQTGGTEKCGNVKLGIAILISMLSEIKNYLKKITSSGCPGTARWSRGQILVGHLPGITNCT
jgi:hypothetical protein